MIYSFYTLSASSDTANIRYVGVTCKTVLQRFYGHKYCAMHSDKRGLPVHKWMWHHYLLGEDIIVTEIDQCEESDWGEREQYWIQHYRDLGFDLLNIDKGGRGVITKEKRSKSSIERSIDAHKCAVVALNKDGSFFKEFESINEATKFFNLKSKSAISNVLKGRSKSCQGYLWVYAKDYNPENTYSYNPKTRGIKVYEFDIDGLLLNEYKSKRSFDNLKGWSFTGVQSAIKNKTIYHDHYWSEDRCIDVTQFEPYFNYQEVDSDNNIIELFRTQSEICDKYAMSASQVCIYIKEHKLFGKNYIIKL